MKKLFKKFLSSCKGGLDVTGIVVDIALIVALIPVIVTFIANGTVRSCGVLAEHVAHPFLNVTTCVNSSVTPSNTSAVLASSVGLSGTETLLLGLTTLFIVLALVFMIVKQSGLMKKK